jgi:acrylyl-CoA reductase (NADPH)
MNDKKTFKAFRVEEENEKFVSAIKEMPFEVIEEGEVLIKVH